MVKIKPDEEFRKLQLEYHSYRYKDTTTSDKFGGPKFVFEVTVTSICRSGDDATEKPKTIHVPEEKKRNKALYEDIDDETVYVFGDECLSEKLQPSSKSRVTLRS